MAIPSHRRRVMLDWGAAMRLLDEAQWAMQHDTLTPRVRALLDCVVGATGWPQGKPGPDRHAPDAPRPVDRKQKTPRRKGGRKRKN